MQVCNGLSSLYYPRVVLETLITEKSVEGDKECVIQLPNIPGGVRSFEFVSKFCYGAKLELTASNVVYLRCAAEHLEMTEELEEGNLIARTEIFINQVIMCSCSDSIRALQTCDYVLSYAEDLQVVKRCVSDSIRALQTCDYVLSYAEDLQVIKRCVESIAVKACTDPYIYNWPILDPGPTQSPGGSLLWNGISTRARPRNSSSDWWYEDVSSLSLYIFKSLISVMESRGVRPQTIAGSLAYYVIRYLPGFLLVKASKHFLRWGETCLEKQKARIVKWLHYCGSNWVVKLTMKKLPTQCPTYEFSANTITRLRIIGDKNIKFRTEHVVFVTGSNSGKE